MESGSFFSSTPHKRTVRNAPVELFSLALHWAWYFGIMFAYLSPMRALLYFVTSQAGCGIFLAIVFALNVGFHPDAQMRPDSDTVPVFPAQRHACFYEKRVPGHGLFLAPGSDGP